MSNSPGMERKRLMDEASWNWRDSTTWRQACAEASVTCDLASRPSSATMRFRSSFLATRIEEHILDPLLRQPGRVAR